jgi:hypothetical protein
VKPWFQNDRSGCKGLVECPDQAIPTAGSVPLALDICNEVCRVALIHQYSGGFAISGVQDSDAPQHKLHVAGLQLWVFAVVAPNTSADHSLDVLKASYDRVLDVPNLATVVKEEFT